MKSVHKLPGKSQWAALLAYTVQLHGRATHPPRPPFPYPWEEIGPGYASSPAFGHWDIVHQILDVLPYDPQHARFQILNNLVCQQENGFLPGTIWMKSGEAKWSEAAGHPPVWPVAVEEWTTYTGSTELMEQALQPLLRQIQWFENNRATDPDGFYYTDISERRWESGVDEGVRFDEASAGKYTCVDATSHLYQLYSCAAKWLKFFNSDNNQYQEKAERLGAFISGQLYDEDTGWFYDIWSIDEKARRRWALEGMWPLVVGAATADQAGQMVENLLNPQRFFTPHPPCSVARCDAKFELRMWRGPSWNSMTYWAARGCLRYGFRRAARLLVEKALDCTGEQFERTGKIWEFYHPFAQQPEALQRKPDTEWNAPFTDYLGHNPLLAMARIYDDAAGHES